MKKKTMEFVMAGLLLLGILGLTRGMAITVAAPGEKAPVVVIDPGHGGRDPGMVGLDGLEEKGINLEISRKLKAVLEEQGYEVVMTREEDVGLYDEDTDNKKAQDMQRRCELIAETKPALTVSIHQNSYNDPSVKGPQVFYYEDSSEGAKLAALLQEQLNTALLGGEGRQEKGNRSYYLLKRSEGVLVIVECGFLTNQEDAGNLVEEAYQQKIAEAICQGIGLYLEDAG